jgi:hypothetical protein
MDTASYVARTEANVIDSHCTVVFTYGKLTGGSKKTVEFAEKYQRPVLCIDLAAMTGEQAVHAVLEWLSPGGVMMPNMPLPQPFPVLNAAGSRESKAPGIHERVRKVMMMVLKPPFYPPGAE